MSETVAQTKIERCQTPPHALEGGAQRAESRVRWVVLLTFVMMVVELVAGIWSGSMALTADGWHMATHVGALGFSALAYWFARTRATHDAFSFGTGKVYALAGYTSAVALGLAALWMVVESVGRLLHPNPIHYEEALPVAILGLLVNIASAALLHHDHGHGHDHGHDHDHASHEHSHGEHDEAHKDHNLRAAYAHVLADALTSVLAIVALAAGMYLSWSFVDPLMGIVGAVVILHWGVGLVRSSGSELLDTSPSLEAEAAVRSALEKIDDVRVTDLHLWEVGQGQRYCMVSFVTREPRATGYYRAAILGAVRVDHLTVEVHRTDEADMTTAH
ncbi:MAG: CDF family Co(II)/Ni(II) efflux transporter DmeF [Myxococcales bacterium]|nr:CDF family Co(II)/Ni(II) efflux transporter DmeF [Myxococcales bacterium]